MTNKEFQKKTQELITSKTGEVGWFRRLLRAESIYYYSVKTCPVGSLPYPEMHSIWVGSFKGRRKEDMSDIFIDCCSEVLKDLYPKGYHIVDMSFNAILW